MICPWCKWDWKPKVENPVSCPRCKARLDVPGAKKAANRKSKFEAPYGNEVKADADN